MIKILKKALSLSFLALIGVAIVGCDDKTGNPNETDKPTEGTEGPKIPEGYTSLINENTNPAIDSDGYYTVGGKKIKTKDVLKTIYQTEISKDCLNYYKNTWTYNSEHYTNMVDGLVENDKYGNIVGALAYAYKCETIDGKQVWTFKIREGVKWVKNDTGEVVAEVKADDFIAGIEYICDPLNGSSLYGVIKPVINNVEEYYTGLSTIEDASDDISFDKVGVKAIDDYTIQYTLKQATPYFLTCLTYSPYLPVNRDFFEKMGTDFGKTENYILVNGAFRMTEHVNSGRIVFTKNDKYWDKEHVYINKLEKRFVPDSTTSTTIREWYESGEIDSFVANSKDEVGYKKYVLGEDGKGTAKNPVSDECNGVLAVGDATYVGYFNFNRTTFEDSSLKDPKTAEQKAATTKALANVNFRKAFLYGLKVETYLEIYNKYAPLEYLMRGYTNRELCAAGGKDYADYVDAVFNREQGTTGVTLTGINNGSDPVYSTTKATEFAKVAKKELLEAGLKESDFPIIVNTVLSTDAEVKVIEDRMYKLFNETCKDVIEVVGYVAPSDDKRTEWMNQTNNYDFSMMTGWGPDYADPNTFLHTFCIDGDMVEQLGFTDENHDLQEEILGAYDAKYREAAAIVDGSKIVERFEKMAEAEYSLIYDYAIVIPWLTVSGYRPSVSKIVPLQAGKATYGLTSDKFKNVIVSDTVINKETRKAIVDAYNAGK